jgi:hypothetical protein
MDVFWTAVVGVAGIAAAFFAPTYAERVIEGRRQAREFRRAKRLVSHELGVLAQSLKTIAKADPEYATRLVKMANFFAAPEWEEHKPILAACLPEEAWAPLPDIYTKVEFNRAYFSADRPLQNQVKKVLATEAEQAEAAKTILDNASFEPD